MVLGNICVITWSGLECCRPELWKHFDCKMMQYSVHSCSISAQRFSLPSQTIIQRVLQRFLLILGCSTRTENRRIFFQRNIIHHFWPAVLRFFGYGRIWVTDDIPREDDVRADHRRTCGPRNPTGNERIGRCARRQVRLAAGAVVVVDANNDGAVMIAATDHWSIPIKVQVPPCPCFLYLCLDLWEGKTKA